MRKMIKVYLDNCCYNRPFDDQSQTRIRLESQAKIQIQKMIQDGTLSLVSSYILWDENNRNPKTYNKNNISQFILNNTQFFISTRQAPNVEKIAIPIQQSGIKSNDALHIASAIFANCNFFITTDDRLLKYTDSRIIIYTPIDFIKNEYSNCKY